MPLYEIRCKRDGTIEVLSKEPPATCPKCGGEVGPNGCRLMVGSHARTPGRWTVDGCPGGKCGCR